MIIHCVSCKKPIDIPMTPEQQSRLMIKRDKNIQELLPDLAPKYREMLISGICPDCWEKMWGC